MKSLIQLLLPPGYEIDSFAIDESRTIEIKTSTPDATGFCPVCGLESASVHGYYQRIISDLPMLGHAVKIRLRLRRFRCLNETCERQTFGVAPSNLIARYQRKTDRLKESLYHIGQSLGGQAGARLAAKLSMPASRDTLLRLVRTTFEAREAAPEIIGIDDWAMRKGRTYGTIIVDLAKRRVVDLLPSRSAEDVAEWLKTQLQVTVVSRDRSKEYRNAIADSLPNACQVVDRWHLVKNLREALERSLDEIAPSLKKCYVARGTAGEAHLLRPRFPRAGADDRRRAAVREQRIRQYKLVQELKANGVSIRQIADLLGLARNTVRILYNANVYPETNYRETKHSILDPFLPYLEQRVQDGCMNAKQLWREIVDQGYQGTHSQVTKWMHWRRCLSDDDIISAPDCDQETDTVNLPSRRELTRLLFAETTALDVADTEMLSKLIQEPLLWSLRDAIHQFRNMIRQKDGSDFDTWIATCSTSGIMALQRFAAGLEEERSAIFAAITTPWSNGQTEGQINRLKMLKRQMYGRANVDLLRARLLYSVDTT